jgi:hypothetical protein
MRVAARWECFSRLRKNQNSVIPSKARNLSVFCFLIPKSQRDSSLGMTEKQYFVLILPRENAAELSVSKGRGRGSPVLFDEG